MTTVGNGVAHYAINGFGPRVRKVGGMLANGDQKYIAYDLTATLNKMLGISAGNLERVTQPDASYIRYAYDNAHRVTDIYDQLNNHIRFTLDGLGNRIQTDTYDPLNALRRKHQNTRYSTSLANESIGAATPPQITKFVSYDANTNLKEVKDPELKTTSFDYDAFDRTWKVYDALNGVTKPTEFNYDAQKTYQASQMHAA